MIRNVIFDLGGVLVDLDKQRCIDSFARIGFDVTPYLGQYEQKGVFRELEMGSVTAREFLDAIDCGAGDEEKVKAWTDFLVSLPGHRKQAILDLRARGYHVSLLSNTNVIDWEHIERKWFCTDGHTVADYFDHVFLSYRMHLMKPDPEIFRRALAEGGMMADETLFVDDSEANCASAASVGLHTLCALGDEWIGKIQ